MHWCDSKKALLNELEAKDCNQSHYSKICGQMYKRLQREHLLLQRSFHTVYQTLNESLFKSQSIEEYVSNISEAMRSDDFDSLTNINPKPEKKSEVHQTEPLESSIPVIMYKKLSKEHLVLQRSFTSVCHSLREALDKSQRPKQQKKYNKDSDELKREIELLKLELQESRDQNELFEFRIHELEQIKEIACIKCCKLESQVLDKNNENQKLNERLNASKRVLNDLIVKYSLNEELENLLLQKCFLNIDPIDKNRYVCSAMTSEDEGLGDDSRRDLSSGPSSLADMQECEFDVICEKTSEINEQNHSNRVLKRSVSIQTESVVNDYQNLISEVNKSRDWIQSLETKFKQLNEEKANLEEQVLELEEAENDARLMSQRLQQQLKSFVDQYETIQLDLINANQTIDLNNNRIENFEKIEAEIRKQMEEIKSVLLKQSSIDSNYYRNEHNFLDETNRKYSIVSVNDDCKPPIDGLYTFLWEKLYRIETQIDCLQQSYKQSMELSDSQETDDDLQLFISTERFNEDMSEIGSSFEVSKFHDSYGQTYGQCQTKPDQSILSTPLCETIKPEKIEIKLDNYWHTKAYPSSSQCLPPEIIDKIYKIEANEQILRQRLVQLEWINKEFVRELELREQIFFQRESHQKEWLTTETEFKNSVNELKCQLSYSKIKSKEFKEQISCLNEKLKSIKNENNFQTNDGNNCVICSQKYPKELEIKINDYLSRIQTFEEFDEQNNFENIKEKYQLILTEHKKYKDIITEIRQSFSKMTDDCPECHQNKAQLKHIETKRVSLMNKLIETTEKETNLQKSIEEKEREWNKIRCIYETKIDALSEKHKRVEKGLKLRMQEMESQTSTTVNDLELERTQIIKQLDEYFNKIRFNEFEYKKEINKLTENVDKIEAKLSKFVDFESHLNRLKSEKIRLQLEIKSIESSEQNLKKKLNEMMEKEAAYEETLSKADKIIGTLEHNYKQRIDELEASETKLKNRITQLEDTESRLRSSLRSERRPSESYGKASDLVQQLIDSEARESTLRQQIKALELKTNQLEQQLEKVNQTKKGIESELKDQDELVDNVHQLQQQIESLRKDLNKSLQTQDSIQTMLKETERFYQKRDEEMQNKYKTLEDQKCNLELTIQHLRHCLRHTDNSIDTHSNNNQNKNPIEFKIIEESNEKSFPKNLKQFNENNDSKENSFKSEELDQTFINVEKCLKRAMAVITLEIKQKDIEDNLLMADSGIASIQCNHNIKKFKVSVETNDCLLKPSVKYSVPNKPFPPKNFKILKRVSSDSLLIGWQNNKDDISGYQILVNEVLVKRVQNPNANKSLVRRLDLNKSFEMKIKSISSCGLPSEEVVTEYRPLCWNQPLQALELTDYSSDSSDSSESSANQITHL